MAAPVSYPRLRLSDTDDTPVPAAPARPPELDWLDARLTSTLETYHQAIRVGQNRLARQWLIDAVRLVGNLWVAKVIGRDPCRLHQMTVSLAWHAYEKTSARLKVHGLLTTLTNELRGV